MASPSLFYAIDAAPRHLYPKHPECPERVIAVQKALDQLQALQQCTTDGQALKLSSAPQKLPEGLLAAVHTAELVERLRATSASISGPTAVRDPDDPDGPTFATPSSFEDAMRAACTAVALLDALVAGSKGSSINGCSSSIYSSNRNGSSNVGSGNSPATEGSHSSRGDGVQQQHAGATTGFSICRPPGHHATPDDQMGFCLLNNVALAARHAQRAHGLQKVLILDWDVHHGNGTQDIFWHEPSVLLIDIHQQDVWPGSGKTEETGEGDGAGTTINVPLPWHSGHSAAQLAFERVVAPAARRFKPDLILVSAGYDAHYQDPLEHLQFQAATYHWLTSQLCQLAAELCGGRLLLLLEGGYNQQALGECVAETVLALLQQPSERPLLDPAQLPHPEPLEQVAAQLDHIRQLHGLE